MNCELRAWRLSDAADLAAMLSNRAILNNLRDGLPFPYTEKDAAGFIASMLSAEENKTFACAITDEDKVIGSIGAFRQGNIHFRTAELGYYLAEPYWGRGIMTGAIRQFCGRIFETTDILRIFAEPFSYNTASCRVLEKAGFQYEGTMKSNAVKNGRIQDMKLYALTRSTEVFPVRRLAQEEIPEALALMWEVFCQFEAPEYSLEGIKAFRAALDDRERTRSMNFYGAFDGEALVGVLAMRKPQHIGGFFVRADHHRRGIGRKLFETMRRDYECQNFTVHASPCGVKVYERLGFVAEGGERTENGLRYTPMRFGPER